MSQDAPTSPTSPPAPKPGRSTPLLLLGGLISLVGLAGLVQLGFDLATPEPRGYVDHHAWAAGLLAPGAAILAIALDARRANRLAVAVTGGVLLAPGLCSAGFIGGGWNERGMNAIGLALGLIVLWGVAAVGLLLLLFRKRPE